MTVARRCNTSALIPVAESSDNTGRDNFADA